MKRGFLLGKFMPLHAGHVALIEAARRLVDRLTVLVCWLPGDPIPGELRLLWLRDMFPHCRIVGHGETLPFEYLRLTIGFDHGDAVASWQRVPVATP